MHLGRASFGGWLNGIRQTDAGSSHSTAAQSRRFWGRVRYAVPRGLSVGGTAACFGDRSPALHRFPQQLSRNHQEADTLAASTRRWGAEPGHPAHPLRDVSTVSIVPPNRGPGLLGSSVASRALSPAGSGSRAPLPRYELHRRILPNGGPFSLRVIVFRRPADDVRSGLTGDRRHFTRRRVT